jgi:hypothetical protein
VVYISRVFFWVSGGSHDRPSLCAPPSSWAVQEHTVRQVTKAAEMSGAKQANDARPVKRKGQGQRAAARNLSCSTGWGSCRGRGV